jgi:hypothetical protein
MAGIERGGIALPRSPRETDSREFLQFIWDGQDGLFELASSPQRRFRVTKRDALQRHLACTYFGPIARQADSGLKAAVADCANVVWADVDEAPGPDWLQERLSELNLGASAIVFSGRGYWVYLKLDQLVPTSEVERLNRGLAVLLDADKCWERNRLARLPGSVNEKTHVRARVEQLDAVLHSPAALRTLGERIQEQPQSYTPDSTPVRIGRTPHLGAFTWNYIGAKPARGQGYDRSVEEHKIFVALVAQGWTDEEIVAFANAVGLPGTVKSFGGTQTIGGLSALLRRFGTYTVLLSVPIYLLMTLCVSKVTLNTLSEGNF